jgi:hypothetical protein
MAMNQGRALFGHRSQRVKALWNAAGMPADVKDFTLNAAAGSTCSVAKS